MYIYTIILLMDSVSLSVCGAYLWSLQTEFWADRFAKCLKMFHHRWSAKCLFDYRRNKL